MEMMGPVKMIRRKYGVLSEPYKVKVRTIRSGCEKHSGLEWTFRWDAALRPPQHREHEKLSDLRIIHRFWTRISLNLGLGKIVVNEEPLGFSESGPVFCGDVYVKTGADYTLNPKVKGKLQTILWKYHGNKVVELEPSEYRWYKFKDQANLNNDTGELTLLKLDKDRSGLYQSEIQVDGKLQNTDFNVVVMDFPVALAVSLGIVAIVVIAVLFLAYKHREWIAGHMTRARKTLHCSATTTTCDHHQLSTSGPHDIHKPIISQVGLIEVPVESSVMTLCGISLGEKRKLSRIESSVFCADVNVDVKTGEDRTLDPKVKGKLQTILWKYQGNKVVELEPTEYRWYKFKDQANLNNDTGVLTLLKLDKDRSGLYQSEIQVDGKLQNSEFNVHVMVDSSVQANFKWSGPNDFDFTGERITISKEQSPETVYICTAANKVSQESTQFSLKECTTASRVEDPVPVGAIAGSVIGVLILIACGVGAVGAVVWYKKGGANSVNGTRYSRAGNGDLCEVVPTDNSVKKEKDGDDLPEKGSESAGQNGVTSSPAAPNDLDKSQTKDKDTPTIRTDEDDSVEKGSDGGDYQNIGTQPLPDGTKEPTPDDPPKESSEAAGQNGVTSVPGPDESPNEVADQSSTTDKGGSDGGDYQNIGTQPLPDGTKEPTPEEQENPDESNATSNQADEDE
ncbi:hypothetical protein NFI96_007803 [Prochilodus magdalenae]|nr:hypothetical protein NFI96_007803 [Prochilodus magdalenae]